MNYQTKRPVIIFSAELSNLTPRENAVRTAEVRERLDTYGILYREVEGHYKGNKETSFVVANTPQTYEDVYVIALLDFDQECILLRGEDDKTYLMNRGSAEYIGKFTQVPEDIAVQQGDYTYDKEYNAYYIVKRG